ncbi:MAG: aminotransferase class I/II-fold pyridoxal phosphate-dependent enzyme [Prevotella sp.]|nr:aminotransferase class I/II-fold pyridoxal phosphate-dependent enzyme [Prevotella sp.]MDD7190862.1 aminotransferase class I/II-fold pyridoxal phosphate-dependent enzyme [Prevotella sp.]MDY5313239.1 aminotransferase class I/II-fold pyridoxal phosphate-dependent enzyme [Prevotella sp.]
MKPASRVDSIQEYYFSRKLKEVAKLNAEGKDIISLAIGSPDMPPSKQTIDKLCAVANEPDAHGYQPTSGLPELHSAMAGFYKRTYGVDLDAKTEVQPIIGSKEGIMYVTLAFCNPGDKVLIPDPGYPTYTAVNKLFGTQIVNYDLREDNGWQPDFDKLEKMDLSGVKVMWSNYPNMPTGGNARRETFERLVAFAKEHDILVVNDNPYSLILNEHPMSIMQVHGAKDCCIEFNSMSKSHNMPGWRVAMIVGNKNFISWMFKIQSNIENGTFRGIQLAAAEAFNTNTPEWHRENNIENYRRRRVIAEDIMKALGCTFDPKQVGMFLWGKIPDRYADVEDLTEAVLHKANVFITPGFIFGNNGKRYIRISLCAKDDKMKEALERIIKAGLE